MAAEDAPPEVDRDRVAEIVSSNGIKNGRRCAMSENGLITIRSRSSVKATIDSLEASLKDSGVSVFARIDHAACAASGGMSLRPPEVRSFVALETGSTTGCRWRSRLHTTACAPGTAITNRGRGLWRVGGQPVNPKLLRRPSLVVVPSRNRIVPPSSVEPPAAQLAAATVLWTPIAQWLRARLSER